ncbi:histidine kinase [Pseudoduganella flava]|uniref:Histidine kinase n=1 Tax=Pseudoduganella flava TaxID=871742 RepID=A0A562Q0D9_9BURK|nr:histidine kinase [Pseudoduganella flava]QGZ38533.1 sensor histidine kinase [Pseudoduganella flava]TWI49910.1 histidine kinase [Pseudoduganella flava]
MDADLARRRLHRMIAAAWALFWVLMIVTAVQDFLRNDEGPLWHPLLWESSSAFTATVLLLAQRRFTRRYDHLVTQPRAWFARQAPWLLVYWIGFVPIAFGIRHGVYALAGETYPHGAWLPVFIYEDVKITIFFAIFVVVTFGVLSWQVLQAERLRAEQMATQLRTAQLQQLTQQMQPHFLFNALNTIAATMHEDVERADALLMRLSDLLRTALTAGARQQVPLADELRLLRAYADLMAERFADRVVIDWQVEHGLDTYLVPAMCLQPLLENVFCHTVERRRDAVRIVVTARCDGTRLLLAVADDAGSLAAPPPAGSAGIALANLRARLHALHGAAATLTLTQLAPAGVRAALALPLSLPRMENA